MKKLYIILPLALILCFMFGCKDKAAMAELEKFKSQAAVEEQNKEIVKRLYEEFNKGNVEILNELCAPDYSFYYPSNSPKPMSREEIIEILKMILKAIPDYNWTIEELFAVKDWVIARISSAGTFTGDYYGIPATGNKVESSAIFIARIENGKIVEERKEGDVLNVMQQLGMELKPKGE